MNSTFNIFLSAGEASGEAYGALLLMELKSRCPDATFFGMGGERMEALGFERVVRSEDVAVMGITEVIRHLPRIYGEYRKLKAAVRSRATPNAGCGGADRLSGYSFEAGGRVSSAGDSGDLLCEPAALGVEEGADQAGAAVCGPDAGDLSV